MKVEFINPFTEATFAVLRNVLEDESITRGALVLSNDPHLSRGVATIVGVSGKVAGHVIFDMDKKTALAVASFMNGEPLMGVDNIVRSTINEVANMVSGNAVGRLNDGGFPCDITPPTFIVGINSEVYAHKGMQHLVVPFETRCGRITVSVALVEKGQG